MVTHPYTHIRISFFEWKDDCIASKSNKASKSGSIWVWTITIIQNEIITDSSRSTYPIAIGPKNDSHDAVEKIIAADLIHMSNNQTLAFIGGRMK